MTHLYCRKKRSRGLPAMMLMAVIFVIGIAMAFFATQNTYADESEGYARFISVDAQGNTLSDAEYGLNFFSDETMYLKLDTSGMGADMTISEPTLNIGSEYECKPEDGYSYDSNKKILTLNGEKLWEVAKQKEETELYVSATVSNSENEEIDWPTYSMTLYEAFEDYTEDEPQFVDDRILQGKLYWTRGEECSFCGYSRKYPEGQDYNAELVNVELLEQNPANIATLKESDGEYVLDAIGYGQIILRFTVMDDENKSWQWNRTVNIVKGYYQAGININEEDEEGLPGDEWKLEAYVGWNGDEEEGSMDDFEYCWKLENEEEEGKLFELNDNGVDGTEARIRFKSMEEIKESFPEDTPEELLERVDGGVCKVLLTVKRGDSIVAEDYYYIHMTKQLYRIGKPGERDLQIFEGKNETDPFDLILYSVEIGQDDKKIERAVDSRYVEFSIAEEAALEYMDIELVLNGNKAKLKSNDKDSIMFYMGAKVEEPGAEEVTNVYQYYKLVYVPKSLSQFDINMNEKICYIEEGETRTIDQLDVTVSCGSNDGCARYVISPDEYDLKVYYCSYDGDSADTDVTNKPLGIMPQDKTIGYSEYRLVAKAKTGSKYKGKCEESIILIDKYKVNDYVCRVDIDQEEINSENLGSDYDYEKYEGFYLNYPHYRYRAGTERGELSVTLMEDRKLKEDRDFYVEYYERNPKSSKPEEELEGKTPLEGFPTEPGTYLAKLIAKAPYNGSFHYAFDLTEDLGKATVTGIKTKTHNGKRQRQVPVVKLNGILLKDGLDYEISYDNNVKAGKNTAKMYITGINKYRGKISKNFTINKGKNTITVSGKKYTLKAKTLKKKNQTIKKTKAFKIAKNKGKVTFKKAGLNKKKFNKKFTVNAKTGNITVKKGVKKGTYKLKVKVTAAGDRNYNKLTKTVTVTIKVK